MIDQAANLRHLVQQAQPCSDTGSAAAPLIVPIVGACPGVGATTLALNLAAALADGALRVVLIDAHLEDAALSRWCQLTEGGHIGDILAARRDIHEVLERGPGGVLIVPGVAAEGGMPPFSQHAQLRFWRQITGLGRHADVVLLDAGPAAQALTRHWCTAAGHVVLVTSGSPTAVIDGYAAIKHARHAGGPNVEFELVVNRIASEQDGRHVFARIDRSAQRFINCQLIYLGGVVEDASGVWIEGSPCPRGIIHPQSPAAGAIHRIADQLTGRCQPERKNNQRSRAA